MKLLNIRRSHLSFHKTHLDVYLPHSKTDSMRKGSSVVIAKTDSILCPVHFLKRYLFLANIHREDDVFIFRNIIHCTGTGERKLALVDKPFSYSVCRDELIQVLKALHVDHKSFSLHSFRSGGASAAAASQVPDRLFKAHCRWRSDGCKDGYVEDSLQNRLEVTLEFGFIIGYLVYL